MTAWNRKGVGGPPWKLSRCWCSLLLLTVLGGCARPASLETRGRLQQIQANFDRSQTADDFLRVAAEYQEVLDGGWRSAAVLFNQGNAFMRAQQRGRAVACYRQAIRDWPQNPYVKANLRAAGQGVRLLRDPWWRNLLFWQSWLGYRAKFQAMFAFACVACASGCAALCATRDSRRQGCRRMAAAALGICFVAALTAAGDWYCYEALRHGAVVVPETLLRKGNGEDYEVAWQTPLRDGDEFTVLESRGDWLLVSVGGGEQEGWIRQAETVQY